MPTIHIHRIPVAEEFIVPIGEAVCVCQYLDDILLCIGRRLSDTFYGFNENKTSGKVTENLKKAVDGSGIDTSLKAELLQLCAEAEEIFRRRNEVVHSRGYTKSNNIQSRLYRSESRANYVYLEPERINDLTREAAAVACKAAELLHHDSMPKAD